MESAIDPRQLWEQRYTWLHAKPARVDPWLARWLPLVETTGERPVLDLGCGSGQDARYLVVRGVPVLACDYAWNALCLARQRASQACYVQVDLRQGMPFPHNTFQVIVAGLCLHYFRWAQTQRILAEIRARLRLGGYLFTRVNSLRDVNYGAGGHSQVEAGCLLVDGELKHFFVADDLRRLFDTGWRIHHLEEMTIQRYHKPKVVWELVAEKTRTRNS